MRIYGSGTWQGAEGLRTKGGSEGSPSAPPQSEAFDTSDLRKSIDEVGKRVEANEAVEVDLRVNTAKAPNEQ